MKVTIAVVVLLVGLLTLASVYSAMHGYSVWYWRNFNARILVNGHMVDGSLHEAKRSVIVTRRDILKGHSYLIGLAGNGGIGDCRDWVAPRFPVVVIGDVNPPCWDFFLSEGAQLLPAAPSRIVTVRGNLVEFETSDGERIAVAR